MVSTKIARYGNSLTIRLPAALARDLELREGDRMTLRREGAALVLERAYRPSLEEMLATVGGPEPEVGAGASVGAEALD